MATATMRKTSFGKMKNLLTRDRRKAVEFLSFEQEGRTHTHEQYETCYVFSGTGNIVIGEQWHWVEPSSLITIPPKMPHWMVPSGDVPLDILIFYHREPIKIEPEPHVHAQGHI